MKTSVVGLLVLTLCCTSLHGQELPSGKAGASRAKPVKRLALKGATVLTVSGEPLTGGTVLIEDGKIAAVGKDLALPEGVQVVDLTGSFLFPGLIDAGSYIGLLPSEAAERKGGLAVKDGLDPFDSRLRRVLAGGVTAAFVSPRHHQASTGVLGTVIRIKPGEKPENMVLKETAAVRTSIGVSSGTVSDTLSRWKSYQSVVRVLKGVKSYTEAKKKYGKDLEKWKKDLKEWRKKVGLPAEEKKTSKDAGPKKNGKKEVKKKTDKTAKKTVKKTADKTAKKTAKKTTTTKKKKVPKRPRKPRTPRKDPVKEALEAVLEKKIPLRVEAHRAEDIRRALNLVETFDLSLVLEGATEAGALAKEVETAGASVVAGPLVLFDPRRLEYANFDASTPTRLIHAGIPVALASASSNPLASRFMGLMAAYAAGPGLKRNQALKTITLDAARILGVEDRIGSIQKGKSADLVVADRHPLETGCVVSTVFIEGVVVYSARNP